MKRNIILIVIGVAQILFMSLLHAQVPSPLSHFGFEIGDDYHLTNYTQTESYFHKVAENSDRVVLQSLGRTEEGRNQYMLIMSSPENILKMDDYQKISRDLALADLPESTARQLAQDGKAVVWIDGGLHSTETVATHQLIETIYQLANRQDEEVNRILDQVIILFVHANPDGHELVGDWYMKEPVPDKRGMGRLPVMYHKYVGHDNNRDFFMFNVAESRNMAKPLFVDWIPQIVYNHHQSAPAGTVVVGPPYRDPFNYVYDPILMTSLDAVGAAMHTRLNVDDKPGYGQRGASRYSTWWNGGLRTSVYFHNMIGILTEIVGGPNPTEIPLYLDRILPNGDSPNPVHPQPWNFKKSIDYSVTLNMAVLNYAANNKADLLYNIYKMGSNSIRKGKQPSLSIRPEQIAFMKDRSGADPKKEIAAKWYEELKENLDRKDPTAYIISADQSDFSTAIKFLNRLVLAGVEVERAEQSFVSEGKTYPEGSYIVRLAQAFRPHILDMFEPQDHPNDVEFEGGPPIPPYDAAGWTLAYTMGVEFDRVKISVPENISVALTRGELLEHSPQRFPEGKYIEFGSEVNDNFKIVNVLLEKGIQCYRGDNGSFYIDNTKNSQEVLKSSQRDIGFSMKAASNLPENKNRIRKQRIALWDNYGGTMKSGWMRWLLEDFNYEFDVIYNPDIDKGGLIDKYDVIIFAGGGIPATLKKFNAADLKYDDRAEEFNDRVGNFSLDRSLPAMKDFVDKGGRVVTIGTSTHLAKHLGIPQINPLTKNIDGLDTPLSRQEFYIPGSVLTATVNGDATEVSGMGKQVDVYFDNSPVFTFESNLEELQITPLLSFDSNRPLKSGWALGEKYLENTVAAYSAKMEQGKIVAFGPEIAFRAQTHGTFKLLFNQLY